jgi:hypothetical protein
MASGRKLIINDCEKCYYFDNEYYHYSEECILLSRRIQRNDSSSSHFPIPDDCPLQKTNEPITDLG